MTASNALTDRMLAMLDSDPSNASLLQECVRVALAEGRPDAARSALAVARDHQVAPTVLDYATAQVLMHEKRWPEAIACLNALVEQPGLPSSDAAAALFMLGLALFHGASFTAAADALHRSVDTGAAPPQAFAWMLRSLHQSGEPAKACEAWAAAPAEQRSALAAGVASLACFDTQDHEQAKALAEACLRELPDCVEALVVKASEDLLEGGTASAMPLLQRALQINERDGRVWSTFATAKLGGGDVDGALQAYERATQTLSDHIGTWSGMAWAHIIKRDLDAARRSLDRAMDIDDRFGETHGGLAVISALQGRREEAQRHIVTARRLDPAGFAWRYAEALLSGEARDAESLQRLAHRLLSSRGYLQFRGPGTTLH